LASGAKKFLVTESKVSRLWLQNLEVLQSTYRNLNHNFIDIIQIGIGWDFKVWRGNKNQFTCGWVDAAIDLNLRCL
jgi:hypothetical protein